jgi:hypothetical protein
MLTTQVTTTTDSLARQPGGFQAILIIALLLMVTGAALVVQALAGPTRRLWLGDWPRVATPLRQRLTASRRTRWQLHVDERRKLESAYPRNTRTPQQQDEINRAAQQANRAALAEPGTPTWMGDRMHAVEQIARNRHGLDLAFAWPRLWLVLPDTTRTEITAAHATFAAAVATGTWAWPYLLLSVLWWPAAVVALGIGVTGWARARAAITDLGALSEAAIDLHGRALAIALGTGDPDATGPLTIAEGEQLTALTRKGR